MMMRADVKLSKDEGKDPLNLSWEGMFPFTTPSNNSRKQDTKVFKNIGNSGVADVETLRQIQVLRSQAELHQCDEELILNRETCHLPSMMVVDAEFLAALHQNHEHII